MKRVFPILVSKEDILDKLLIDRKGTIRHQGMQEYVICPKLRKRLLFFKFVSTLDLNLLMLINFISLNLKFRVF